MAHVSSKIAACGAGHRPPLPRPRWTAAEDAGDGQDRGRNIFNILPVLVRRQCLLALPLIAGIYTIWSSLSPRSEPASCSWSWSSESELLFVIRLFTMLSDYTWGGLAARAVFLMSTNPIAERASPAAYTANAVTAINSLQSNWYNAGTGIWDNAWWNSANALTTLADFASINVEQANRLNIGGIIANTFAKSQQTSVQTLKVITAGLVSTKYSITKRDAEYWDTEFSAQGFVGFINEFYDDEGWWALGLIRAFDITRNQEYLNAAVKIFADMRTGEGTNCGGGIYWNKERKYVNAIANELYLSVAASLANRVPGNRDYLNIANKQWAWFKGSGMINAQGTINDGLDGNCRNNGANTWSYNQGVILGGLVELSRATGDKSLLSTANGIAKAAIAALQDKDGVLHDTCEPNCGADGNQFKGIFVRNLRYLQQAAPDPALKNFIIKNADVIWANDRDAVRNTLGVVWSGPFQGASGPTHSSALDAIVAAMAVS
jgi:predicted alpha-1,6-mannanase (GH76 family)